MLAKQVTATRPRSEAITSARVSRTSDSEPEWPSTIALVESQIIASTPCSPSAANAASSVGGPTSGCGSSFQSPVCSTVPAVVVIASACASGTECATRRKRSANGPSVKALPGGTTCSFTSDSNCTSASLRRSTAAANGLA